MVNCGKLKLLKPPALTAGAMPLLNRYITRFQNRILTATELLLGIGFMLQSGG